MKISYNIIPDFDGMTVDAYLTSFHLAKNRKEALYKGFVFLNDQPTNPFVVLKTNDILTIDYQEKVDFLPDKKKLNIAYEDDYLLIVNKPTHILVHPDDKNKVGTMCNIVSYYYLNSQIQLSVKYAHRLDMDTTGLLIFVKDALTHAKIDEMIATHELKRTYLCLVSGHLPQKKGTIDLPIGKNRHESQKRRVSKTGKPAITHYEVIQEFKKYSLVKVNLETGRTHQIRVHMSFIGHPLLGDTLYGGSSTLAKRPLLHSYQVDLIHPVTHQAICIKKDLPFDMKKLL